MAEYELEKELLRKQLQLLAEQPQDNLENVCWVADAMCNVIRAIKLMESKKVN